MSSSPGARRLSGLTRPHGHQTPTQVRFYTAKTRCGHRLSRNAAAQQPPAGSRCAIPFFPKHGRHPAVKRRDFITLLGGAAAGWPLAARAQQAGKLPTVGLLVATTLLVESPRVAAFVQRLRELGWIESRTVAIEVRYADGRNERFAEIAAEFVRLKVIAEFTSRSNGQYATWFSESRSRHWHYLH